MRYHHLAVLCARTKIDILALYFLFFRIVVNAGDSIFDYDPFTALDPVNVASRIKNDDKQKKKTARKREDKTVSTVMWDSFGFVFARCWCVSLFFGSLSIFPFYSTRNQNETPCLNVLKFRLEMSFKEYMPKIT